MQIKWALFFIFLGSSDSGTGPGNPEGHVLYSISPWLLFFLPVFGHVHCPNDRVWVFLGFGRGGGEFFTNASKSIANRDGNGLFIFERGARIHVWAELGGPNNLLGWRFIVLYNTQIHLATKVLVCSSSEVLFYASCIAATTLRTLATVSTKTLEMSGISAVADANVPLVG